MLTATAAATAAAAVKGRYSTQTFFAWGLARQLCLFLPIAGRGRGAVAHRDQSHLHLHRLSGVLFLLFLGYSKH
jgi:threonine/homoserine/homoserine lactone efflux protein